MHGIWKCSQISNGWAFIIKGHHSNWRDLVAWMVCWRLTTFYCGSVFENERVILEKFCVFPLRSKFTWTRCYLPERWLFLRPLLRVKIGSFKCPADIFKFFSRISYHIIPYHIITYLSCACWGFPTKLYAIFQIFIINRVLSLGKSLHMITANCTTYKSCFKSIITKKTKTPTIQ